MAKGKFIELMDDMHLSNESLFHTYYDNVVAKNISNASQIIENNTQLQNQITDSDNINKLISRTNSNEQQIKTDVDEYLQEQLEAFQDLINQTGIAGTYNPSTQYELHNLVYYQDKGYYAYKRPPVGTIPTNTDYWLEYDIRGLKGYGGINLNYKFTWNADIQYQVMDCVDYQNKLWFANQPSKGVPPSLSHFPWLPIMMPLEPVKAQISTTQPTAAMSAGDFWFKIIKGEDLKQLKWSDKASQIYARYASAVFTFGNEIHIVGGDNSLDEKQVEHQVYNTLTNTWSEKATLPVGVSGMASFTIGDKGYSAGGIDASLAVIATTYIYDNTTNTWSTGADIPTPIVPSMNGCSDGTKGYFSTAIGTNSLPSNLTYSYDPTADTWTQLANCPNYLAGSNSAYYNGKIYVMGGINYTGSPGDFLYIYDIVTNTWSQGQSEGLNRSYASTFVIGDKIYRCGGLNSIGYSMSNTMIYDTTTNTWTNENPMQHKRNSASGATVNGKGYVIGGININNDFGAFGYNEEYNPEG
nr:MAG TPA: Kelch repeat [Caudoviricetes sp.]